MKIEVELPTKEQLEAALVAMEKQLVDDMMPEAIGTGRPADHVRLSTGREHVRRFTHSLLSPYRHIVERLQEGNDEARELVTKAQTELEQRDAAITQLRSDLRACQELRGTYESTRVKELEKELAAAALKLTERNRLVEQLTAQLDQLTQSTLDLQREITGREAQTAAYARNVQELTTAAQQSAQTQRELAAALRLPLNNALEKIHDRWQGKPGPFLETVCADLHTALKLIPA